MNGGFQDFQGPLNGPNGIPILGKGLQAQVGVIAESVVRTQAIQMAVQLAVANPAKVTSLTETISNAQAIFDYVVTGQKPVEISGPNNVSALRVTE